MTVEIVSTEWSPERFHGVAHKKRRWRLTELGIEVEGRGYPTSKSQPHLADKVCKEFEGPIRRTLESFGQELNDVQDNVEALRTACLLVATICNESAGNPDAAREEKHLNDWSFGCTQMLTSTAHYVARKVGWPMQVPSDAAQWALPRLTIPKGGTKAEWKRFLGDEPYHACLLAMTLHKINDARFKSQGDPVLATTAYNSGGIRIAKNKDDPWGLHATMHHITAFVHFYNGAANHYLAGVT